MADSGGVLGGPLWSPMERAGPGGGGGGGGGEERTEQRASERADSWLSEQPTVPPLSSRTGCWLQQRAGVCARVCVRADSMSGGGNTVPLMC